MMYFRETKPTRRGAAAAELAVLLPFLATIFVMAIDFARVYYYAVTLEGCARNGAYYASDYPGLYDYSSASNAALADANDLSPTPTVDIKYDRSATGAFTTSTPSNTGYVKVTVSWDFSMVTKYPLPGIPNTFTISRSVIMKMAPILIN